METRVENLYVDIMGLKRLTHHEILPSSVIRKVWRPVRATDVFEQYSSWLKFLPSIFRKCIVRSKENIKIDLKTSKVKSKPITKPCDCVELLVSQDWMLVHRSLSQVFFSVDEVIFIWLSKVIRFCFGFALLHLVIGFKNSRYNQKQKPIWFARTPTRFPALRADYIYLPRILIGLLNCLCPLLLAVVTTLVLVIPYYGYTTLTRSARSRVQATL